jgi:2-polyprenyl-3-methyl-5-hydroxy-6-metoxy-1,4-benzoquinol methylase
MRGVGLALRYFNHLRMLTAGYVPERFRPAEWDKLFETGAYDRLFSTAERGRYSLIVGHCDVLGPKRILDVGCGQGVLAERLKRVPYERYVGVDISQAAIAQAERERPDPRNAYLTADATKFETAERFDLIVFNECLYYMEDPAALVRHYLRFLAPGGWIIVSMYETLRSRTVWPLLAMLSVLEATDIRSEGTGAWTVKLMQAG